MHLRVDQDEALFHEAASPLRELLAQKTNTTNAEMQTLSIPSLRDKLVAIAPLDLTHIKQVNTAEAQAWSRAGGLVQKDSTDILGFECGGQQWVHEVCFPCGTQSNPSLTDIDYMLELLSRIEAKGIPAPGPIEQVRRVEGSGRVGEDEGDRVCRSHYNTRLTLTYPYDYNTRLTLPYPHDPPPILTTATH